MLFIIKTGIISLKKTAIVWCLVIGVTQVRSQSQVDLTRAARVKVLWMALCAIRGSTNAAGTHFRSQGELGPDPIPGQEFPAYHLPLAWPILPTLSFLPMPSKGRLSDT
ncbi:hypothetical protein DSO57_1037815 [Entomophthora muscae]|uniref:Uncharacterized protein n=1 Tax=Entomophthora muscae TaxID=34485 RepID=A0ACC2TL38_9FUNG|nr:hypothetical protein DSO57_1037815 [Entomophthora muscae]